MRRFRRSGIWVFESISRVVSRLFTGDSSLLTPIPSCYGCFHLVIQKYRVGTDLPEARR